MHRLRSWLGVSGAVAVAAVVAANALVLRPVFWRAVLASEAHRYAAYHPVAKELPSNAAAPRWARGGTVLLGASTLGASLPTARTEALLGRRAWTVWCSGARPPEFLALAPYVMRARPKHVSICLEVRHAGIGGENPFSAANRAVYAGPLNPAWRYHTQEPGTVLPLVYALPLFRVREPLRALAAGYARKWLAPSTLPRLPVWEHIARRYENEYTQRTLATYRTEPTRTHYEAYLRAVGLTHAVSRGFWYQMRALEPDVAGTGANVRALLETTAYLRAGGATVSWFLFPENPMCSQLVAANGAVLAPPNLQAHAREFFPRLAAEQGVPFVDFTGLATADEFVDEAHLAPPAAVRLGARVRVFLDEVAPR